MRENGFGCGCIHLVSVIKIHLVAAAVQGKDYIRIVDAWKALHARLSMADAIRLYNVVFQG